VVVLGRRDEERVARCDCLSERTHGRWRLVRIEVRIEVRQPAEPRVEDDLDLLGCDRRGHLEEYQVRRPRPQTADDPEHPDAYFLPAHGPRMTRRSTCIKNRGSLSARWVTHSCGCVKVHGRGSLSTDRGFRRSHPPESNRRPTDYENRTRRNYEEPGRPIHTENRRSGLSAVSPGSGWFGMEW